MAFLGGAFVLLAPFGYAIFILRKLDAAAKQRKQSGGGTRIRLMIVDFFSLMLLIQVPFNFVDFEYVNRVAIFLIVISLIALLLIWLTTIKTVSQAGIVSFGWRALISMILIPTMYIGSFYFGGRMLGVFFGHAATPVEAAWLVAAFIGMVLSPWIVNGALKAAATPVSIDPVTGTPDPFAD